MPELEISEQEQFFNCNPEDISQLDKNKKGIYFNFIMFDNK